MCISKNIHSYGFFDQGNYQRLILLVKGLKKKQLGMCKITKVFQQA